jgi:hypothetical protein
MLLLRARQLALDRLVLGADPMLVGEQNREFLLQSGEFGIHHSL